MSHPQSDDDLILEMLPVFIEEANEQSASLEQLLLQLEAAPHDSELLNALFRCAHTIKGSAGVFGLDRVVIFTHHVEALLHRLREGQVQLSPELSTLLLQSNDVIHALVNEARDVQAVPPLDAFDPENCHLAFTFNLDTTATREEIKDSFKFARDDCELTIAESGAATKDVVALIEAIPDQPRLGDSLVSAGAISRVQLLQGLQTQNESTDDAGSPGATRLLGEVLQSSAAVSPTVVAAALQKQQRQRSGGAASGLGDDSSFIRVHAERLDEVINLLGELVIAGAGASMLARQTRQSALVEAHQQVTRLIEDIRNSTLKLRMVPIGETFTRFRRVVRDTAAELGKDVALDIEGGDTELDKAMVERIADPLMHLVRNALDHGLETPEQRVATSKPPQGKLTLSACHESGSILIRITDDGRGVGMDVVRSNVEALRGSVTISSEVGQGSCIEIRMPLTLAIIDGFLVGVGPSKFILPLDAVVEVIANRAIATTQDARGRCCVELRGEMLPVVNLRTLYALDSPQPERSSVVVVRSGTHRYGVLVDALLGQHQTVIKPLGLMLRSLRGVSGSSILGTGEVALIFDAASLGQLAAQPRAVPGNISRSDGAASPIAHSPL